MASAHYSLRIMCHLPFKMHVYFISALRCHRLNAKGPFEQWQASPTFSLIYLWWYRGGKGNLMLPSTVSVIILQLTPYSTDI